MANKNENIDECECKFCEIYSTNSVKALSDKILYESKSFYVIPALGCIVKNYIMIISKRHINSMCYLTNPERKELIELINRFRILFKKKYGFYPIIFEHGASKTEVNRSSCCIVHAHIHIVPYVITKQQDMINNLKLLSLNDFEEFFNAGYETPYIFYMDNQGQIYFKDCKEAVVPSQIIRKWIASDMGQPNDWDWRNHSFDENIEATVSELKPLIKKSLKSTDYRLKYVYYCRAMDGLDADEIEKEYDFVEKRLSENGRILVNPYSKTDHKYLKLNKTNSSLVVEDNLDGISKSDCVIVNLSIKNHLYIGCIAEMVYAREKGCYVIVITGDSGAEKHFHTIYHADKIYKTLDELFESIDWHN